MGLSSNQARFLSLTSRQVDLEQRIQQICQRRLRLSSELENVATSYNNKISNRKMFTPSMSGLNALTKNNLQALGYKVINAATKTLANSPIKAINQLSESQIKASYDEAHTIRSAADFQTKVNADVAGSFILAGDIDMSELGVLSSSVVTSSFGGVFDGNGYEIKNLSINTSNQNYIALFGGNSGTIKNVSLENANVTNTNGSYTSALVGINGGTIDNCYTTGTINGYGWTGGIAGSNEAAGRILNSWSSADVSGYEGVGGISGASANGNTLISNCYSTGDINGTTFVGGVTGVNRDGNAIIENSYSTSNVTGINYVGGVTGGNYNMVTMSALPNQIVNCYSANSTVTGSNEPGGVVGHTANGYTSTGSFYYNNGQSSDSSGATQGINTTGWDTSIWDTSTTLPSLRSSADVHGLEEGLRNGEYSLVREADEFTQDPLTINGDKYQEVDWRSTPEIYDELYKGDDVDAENKYDKTISEINAQDKKLQLEQTSVEVEYKAISSERESVKKILDTNAQSSFKYFS